MLQCTGNARQYSVSYIFVRVDTNQAMTVTRHRQLIMYSVDCKQKNMQEILLVMSKFCSLAVVVAGHYIYELHESFYKNLLI